MEAGDVVWLLIVLFWLLSGFLSRLRKTQRGKQPQERPAPPAGVPQRPAPAPQRPGISQAAPAARPPARPGLGRPQPPPPPPPPAQRAPGPEDALTNLLKRLGVDVEIPSAQERPVASEHVRTPGEHRRTAAEARRTAAEHAHTPGWHDRTASEVRLTAAEQAVVPSEHRWSASEHRPGDVERSGVAPAPGPRVAEEGSALGRRMVAELKDRDSLARAIVLKEILGPPVGLRPPGSER